MERPIRYGKPCMTNLPPELGVRIFKQILNSPRPDVEKMEAECDRLIEKFVAIREREEAEKNASK